jgi:cytoskeletal protein CcmA (bactofilin family)
MVLIAALLVSTGLPAQDADRNTARPGPAGDDLVLVGERVEILARSEGDVVAAGGSVVIRHSVRGDVLAAGGTVEIEAAVEDDVRAFGGQVAIRGPVRDNLMAAGGSVMLAPTANVGGRAWLAGATVTVHGRIGSHLKAAGQRIVIHGEIGGDAELAGEDIEIGPDSVIRGQLRYLSRNEARIDPRATIVGSITRGELEHDVAQRPPAAGLRLGGFVMLAVAAIVFYLLWPGFSVAAGRTLFGSPGKSLVIGLATLATMPLVIVLLLASVVGVLVALPLLALFPVLLLAGVLTALVGVGDFGLRRLGRAESARRGLRVASIGLTVLALWLLCFLPGIGALLLFALLLFGAGALILTLWARYTGRA